MSSGGPLHTLADVLPEGDVNPSPHGTHEDDVGPASELYSLAGHKYVPGAEHALDEVLPAGDVYPVVHGTQEDAFDPALELYWLAGQE